MDIKDCRISEIKLINPKTEEVIYECKDIKPIDNSLVKDISLIEYGIGCNIPEYYGKPMRTRQTERIHEILDKYELSIDEETENNKEFFDWYYEGFTDCKKVILKMLEEMKQEYRYIEMKNRFNLKG